MNDYIEIIKNQFFSKDNIDFINKIANSKNISIISNQITFNACNNIYNQFIHTVYTQKKTIKPETIEELLITLNKMVIDLIIEDYTTKSDTNHTTKSDTNHTTNIDTIHTNKSDTNHTNNIDTNHTNKSDTNHTNNIDTSDTNHTNNIETSDTNHTNNIETSRTDIEINTTPVNTYPLLIDIGNTNDTMTNTIMTNTIMTNVKQDITRESLYLFSEDSLFKDGEYKFEFRRKNIKNLNLQSFEIFNNLYNVTENNNTIEISEKNNKKSINIPVGCYNLEDLIQCLEKNIVDKCNSNIKITHDKYKNLISIKGDGPFSMNFIENENLFIPLRFILGFDKKDYMNNNIYLTSQHPVCNIYDNIYIKITKNYAHIFNTKWSKDFNFYDIVSFKQLYTFGDDVRINMSNNISHTNIDIDDISLELYYRHIHHRKFYKINQRLKFLMVFNIDKIL